MDLYAELILDHSKNPQHAGLRDPFDAEVYHVNTSCGDELTLRVRLSDVQAGPQAVVEDVSYDALGCSISMASTSILAQECLGRSLSETMVAYEAMKRMLTSRGTDSGDEDIIGDGVALSGVAQYPARVKCALLGWSALLDALARSGADLLAIDATDDATTPAPAGTNPDEAEKP